MTAAPVDEVTMPDAGHRELRRTGTAPVRDLQGKMIAHCENAGDRGDPDAPPGLLPQEISSGDGDGGTTRRCPRSTTDRGHGSAHEAAVDGAAVGHVAGPGPASTPREALQGTRE